jgi:hypothetical protein
MTGYPARIAMAWTVSTRASYRSTRTCERSNGRPFARRLSGHRSSTTSADRGRMPPNSRRSCRAAINATARAEVLARLAARLHCHFLAMIDPADVHGRRLAMIAWGEKPDGSREVVVFGGVGQWDGQHLTLVRDPIGSSIPLQDDWLVRLQTVEPDLKGMLLDADYSFSVSVGPLPEGEELGSYMKTGLRWPGGDES